MEIHARNSVVAKRLWNVLRITFYMVRKGLVSKRKLMMDMNLMMNKRSKLLRKSLSNLMHHSRNHHHHHHHDRHVSRGSSFGLQEYEFSCSNSPNPVFFHLANNKRKHYFPCINPPEVAEAEEAEFLDYDDDKHHHLPNAVVLAPKTPVPSPSPMIMRSPLSVRVSNYSSEEYDQAVDGGSRQVDDEAEEFIRRFYEQLRAQSGVQLFQYQEMQYQEMLARGT